MKRFNFICTLVCALLSLFGSTAYADTGNLIKDQVTVTITDGKYLSELIDEAVAPRITNLKIVGVIDGTDILYLRELLGVGRKTFVEKENIKSNLQILDLSDAYIREGGMTYCDYSVRMTTYHASTSNNVIGIYMFASCHSLKKVTLPYNTTNIGAYAFQNCSELEEIIKFYNISSIGAYAFHNCSLLKEFKLPKLEKLYESTFQGCKSLTSLEIPEGITDLPKSFAGGCSSLKNIVLPKSLNYVGWGALSGCSSLERIDLPETLATIMMDAFAGCTSLKYFRLPEGINELYNHIISGCTALEELHLPKLPLIMNNYAFAKCQVQHLYAYEEKPHKINNTTFDGINYSTCTLHVPKGSREAYAEAYYWRDFGTIVEMGEGEGGDDTPKTAFAVFDPSNGVLTFKYEASKPDGAYSLNEGWAYPEWKKHEKDITKVIFDDSFVDVRPTSCLGWFNGCINLKSIEGIKNLNTENVISMRAMFKNCSGLTILDVSGFNTTNVKYMEGMFENCSAVTTLDVSGFNTANVTSMSNMFFDCSALTTLDVSRFNTTKVNYTSYMFYGCSNLTSLDVSGFDTQNVTDMDNMFYGCSGLTALNVSGFDTKNVTTLRQMFRECSGLTTLDVSGFDTKNVTNMDGMFCDCFGLTSLNITGFNTQNVTDMGYIFCGCSGLTSLDVTGFDTQNVTDIESMFFNCSKLTTLDVSGLDTKNVTNMNYMFYNCSGLTMLDVSNFNTKNVKRMDGMFAKCSKLTSLDLTNYDTKNVESMRMLFFDCNKLATIYVSDKFVTTNVTDGENMFTICRALEGAVSYNEQQTDMEMANYHKGYFKTYYKIGDEIFPLCGETLSVDNLALTDNKDFVLYTPFETNAVSYSSELNEGTTWETLCLPFDVSLANKNFRAFTLLSVKSDVVELQELKDCIHAGTPVIIKMNDGATGINITENNKMIVRERQDNMLVDNCKLVGHYTHKTFGNDDDHCFVINGNKLVKATKVSAYTRSMDYSSNGFRAYMKVCTNTGIPADEYNIDIKGSTAIKLLESTVEEKPEYYDLEGHRLNNLKKGVNIVKRGNKTMKVIIR